MLIWFFGGAELGSVVGLPPAAADAPPIIGVSVFWSPPFLWFYIYFCVRRGASSTAFWRVLFAASLVEVVDPRLRADPLRHLFPGAGERRHQQLVRAVLRPDPGGALEDRRPVDIWRVLLRVCSASPASPSSPSRSAVLNPLLRQPLHLPLAHRDERLLHGLLAAGCAISKAPRSASRKTPCASPRPWRGSAST